jgi:hypothetical protein
MAGKSLKKRVSALKKKVAIEGSGRDPTMAWVHDGSGNIIRGRLLGLHVPENSKPYYRVQLIESCVVHPSRPGRKGKSYVTRALTGTIVSMMETDDISCLRYFIDEMAMTGEMFDVWIRWMPFRQEVHVKKIVEGGQLGKNEDLDDRLS